jgi:hypothetical protein
MEINGQPLLKNYLEEQIILLKTIFIQQFEKA